MGIVSKPHTFTAGTTILSAQVNSNFDTLYNEFNGNITNANLSASASIDSTKISGTVTTLSGTQTISGDKTFSGTSTFSGATTISGASTLSGDITLSGVLQGANPIVFEGATADAFETTIAVTDPTADRTITIPNEDVNLGQQVIKGWLNMDGSGTIGINDSFNVTSLVDNATGDYTINWTTAFANANYAVVGMAEQKSPEPIIVNLDSSTALAVGSTRIQCKKPDDIAHDPDIIMVIAIGDR